MWAELPLPSTRNPDFRSRVDTHFRGAVWTEVALEGPKWAKIEYRVLIIPVVNRYGKMPGRHGRISRWGRVVDLSPDVSEAPAQDGGANRDDAFGPWAGSNACLGHTRRAWYCLAPPSAMPEPMTHSSSRISK